MEESLYEKLRNKLQYIWLNGVNSKIKSEIKDLLIKLEEIDSGCS